MKCVRPTPSTGSSPVLVGGGSLGPSPVGSLVPSPAGSQASLPLASAAPSPSGSSTALPLAGPATPSASPSHFANALLAAERLCIAAFWRGEKARADAGVVSAESALATARAHQDLALQQYLVAMAALAAAAAAAAPPDPRKDDKGKGKSK